MSNQTERKIEIAMVGLDLTEMDDYILKYTRMICDHLKFQKIFFVHIAKDLELPEEIRSKYPDLLAPLDESIEGDIRKKVRKYFEGCGAELDVIIQEGSPIQKMLKLSKIKGVDLMIMGRKKSLKGSGIVASHIARNSPCSLLLVTPNGYSDINKILVPLDFSPHSLLSIHQALDIVGGDHSKIVLAHIYSVPQGHTKIGKSYAEFSEIMKGHAESEYYGFMKKNQLPDGIPCHYLLDGFGKGVDSVYELAQKEAADLIVVGSKGRTNASAIFLGSFAEKLAYKDNNIPVFIVKDKGENLGFLQALLRI
ncbi:MAG: universal stress protein [Bacteroidota bacterium]